jgi:UDP-glucose 4-epimerase
MLNRRIRCEKSRRWLLLMCSSCWRGYFTAGTGNNALRRRHMASKVVLITGVADYWGSRLAERLMAQPGIHVIGLGRGVSQANLNGLDVIQTDVRNPLLADLFKSEGVHTVCHLKLVTSVRPNIAASELNVTGTIKLLEACAEADVKKAVLKSSLTVYGAHPDNPGLLSEANPLRANRRYGHSRHLMEIETFCDGYRRRVPELMLTTLRCAGIVGPTADTPMTRYLRNRWAPTLLGFDPMLQVIHEDDVVEALAHVALEDRPGVYNVAAEGVMPLSRVVALAGTLPLPILHPLAYWGVALLKNTGLDFDAFAPKDPDYLRYSCVGDLTKMREELGFAPSYTAEETLRQFAARHPSRCQTSLSVASASDEQQPRATTERRRGQAGTVIHCSQGRTE